MTETLEQFEARTYWNGTTGKVFVWKTARHKQDVRDDVAKPEEWTMQNAQNYVAWLNDQAGKE